MGLRVGASLSALVPHPQAKESCVQQERGKSCRDLTVLIRVFMDQYRNGGRCYLASLEKVQSAFRGRREDEGCRERGKQDARVGEGRGRRRREEGEMSLRIPERPNVSLLCLS